MSNANENPSFYAGFTPGKAVENGNGVTTHQRVFDLPNGRESMVGIHIGEMQPEAERAKQREHFLLSVYPPNLTEGLEREIERLTAQFNDFTGYDKDGTPIMRVQGRNREMLEMKLANRRNALGLAQRERAEAEHAQVRAAASKRAEEERIQEAAQVRAQEIIEEAEIERRAKQIAKRVAGVS